MDDFEYNSSQGSPRSNSSNFDSESYGSEKSDYTSYYKSSPNCDRYDHLPHPVLGYSSSSDSDSVGDGRNVENESMINLNENEWNHDHLDTWNDEIEMLEENNNDPNNNMGDENDDAHSPIVQPVVFNPQPGCSKDPDVIENKSNAIEIDQTVKIILDLISKISYESIVAELKKNQEECDKRQMEIIDLLLQIKSKISDKDPSPPVVIKTTTLDNSFQTKSFSDKIVASPTSSHEHESISDEIQYISSQSEENDDCQIIPNKAPGSALKIEVGEYFPKEDKVILSTTPKEIDNFPAIQKRDTVMNQFKEIDAIAKTKQSHCCDNPFKCRNVAVVSDTSIPNQHSHIPVTSNENNGQKRKFNEFSMIEDSHIITKKNNSNAGKTIYSIDSNPKRTILYKSDKSVIASLRILNKPHDVKKNSAINVRYNYGESSSKPVINSNNAKKKFHSGLESSSWGKQENIPKQIVDPKVNSLSMPVKLLNQPVLSTSPFALSSNTIVSRPVLLKRFSSKFPNSMYPKNNSCDVPQPGPSGSETNLQKVFCWKTFMKLRAIFPDLKQEYLRRRCVKVEAKTDEDLNSQISKIVDSILLDEASWEFEKPYNQSTNRNIINNTQIKNQQLDIDEISEELAGVFPNADPQYLRETAQKLKNENAIVEFVNEQLRQPNYPTREQYLAKLKITQEQERYTKNFVVTDFIKIFPDPFNYFENHERKLKFDIVGFEFLKVFFNRLRVNTISAMYKTSNYNLSITAKNLQSYKDELKSRRCSREMPTACIPMLQEIAFIRHRNEIQKFIDDALLIEKKEFEVLKAKGELLTCQCCYDTECFPSKCSTCENDHIFCNSCVVQGTHTILGNDETRVPCFIACGGVFSLSTLQKVLSPTKFSILLRKRQMEEVKQAGLEGLVSCPFCHFASIPPEGDRVFKCLNPECMKESCIQCKEPNHVPLRCDEVMKDDQARKYIEEKMTQALARTCYKCERTFFKDEGCNKIVCICGAIMCYLCDKPIKDYNHFAGQGSSDTKKCPLWIDNKRLNAATVRKVHENVRSELLRQNPNLVLDTIKLTPELPPPTQGPHDQIQDADNAIDIIAARVLQNSQNSNKDTVKDGIDQNRKH